MVTASRFPTLFESAEGIAEAFRSAYVPMLLDKRGELQALRKAAGTAWDHMVPLIQIVPKLERSADEVRMSPAQMIDTIAAAVRQHQFYLDPGGVARRTKKSALMSVNDVEAAYAQARRRGLGFIPVLPLNRTDVAQITAEVARDRRSQTWPSSITIWNQPPTPADLGSRRPRFRSARALGASR